MSVQVLLKFENFLGTGVLLTLGVMAIHAQKSSSQLSLTPRCALRSEDATIHGVSLDIRSQTPQHGVALGVVNGSSGKSSEFTMAALTNYNESYTGGAMNLVNGSHTSFQDWHGGLVNYSEGKLGGLQSGWINYSEDIHGVQFGLINYTKKLRGAQVGLLNLALNNPCFKEFPNKLVSGDTLVNWSF
jgi:hypothetical protein